MKEQDGQRKKEIKRILKERSFLKDEIEMLEEDIRGIDLILTNIRTTKYGENLTSKTGKMSDKYSSLLDNKVIAEKKRIKAIAKQNKINKALEIMEKRYDAEYKNLKSRYIEGQTLHYIGRKIGCGKTKTIEEISKAESVFLRLMK